MAESVRSASRDSAADSVLMELLEGIGDRLQAGEPVDVEAYVQAHPEFAERLRQLLPAVNMMANLGRSAASGDASVPPGETDLDIEQLTLGDFRLLREIGRGGMGVVYEAEQVSLGRRVALKVLPFAGAMDARQLQRFRNEAHAAAQLHHTNIVPVHYVGCERGVHFYAMQFIDGRTLAAVIAELRQLAGLEGAPLSASTLSEPASGLTSGRWAPAQPKPATLASTPAPATVTEPPSKLSTEHPTNSPAYFRTVAHLGIQAAEALEHAHQVGVVHRDIKPANLLLDGRGILWITDFGLARLQTDAGLTQSGDLVGTLRYMSPEQALAQRAIIDHRADIYSLGATLYELVTLRPAFDGRDRQEILRQIAQDEPRPPHRLNGTVPRELETVVLKAMAKSPEERYGTARELADDLRRFLDDRPLAAKRPTLWQRAGKWMRRYRAVVRAACGGLAFATVTLAVSTLLVWRAYHAAVEQRQLADQRYREAREQRRQARRAVDKMYLEVAQKWLDRQPQMGELQKQFLQEVLAYYEGFAEEKGEDEEAVFDKAQAYLRVGALLEFSLGKQDEARAALFKANALLEELAQQFPDKGIYTVRLAEAQNLLCFSGAKNGLQRLEQSVSLMEGLVERYPSESEYRYSLAVRLANLGIVCTGSGKLKEGESLCRRAMALLEELIHGPSSRPDYYRNLACTADDLADTLRRSGNWPEAAENYRKAVAAFQRLTPDPSGLPEYQHDLAPFYWHNYGNSYRDLGTTLAQLKRFGEAESAFAKAVRIHAKLVADFPTAGAYHTALFRDYRDKGTMFWARGHSREADRAYSQALGVAERAVAAFPADLVHEFPLFLATCPDPKWRRPQLAQEWATRAIGRGPGSDLMWCVLGIAHYRLADYGSAVTALEKALSLGAGGPEHFFLAMAHWGLGDKRQARQWYEKGIAWMNKHRPQDSDLPRYRAEAAALLGIKDSPPASAEKKRGPSAIH